MNAVANHTLSGYDSDLNDLTAKIAELGSVVEAMVTDAILSMKSRDGELARSVIDRDSFVHSLHASIEDDAIRFLALRSPMATDLRRTIAVIRVAVDLVRVGGLAGGIARRALEFSDTINSDLIVSFLRMGRQVRIHLAAALDGFLRDDIDTALQTWSADQNIDEMYNVMSRDLLMFMSGNARSVDESTRLLFAVKNLERIGDHTSNICEVIYHARTGQQLINDDSVRVEMQKRANGEA